MSPIRHVALAGSPLHILALAAALLAAWQSVASPTLVLSAAAGFLFLVLATWSLLAGLVVFTVLTFPAQLPAAAGVGTLAKPAGLVLAFSWLLVVLKRRDDVPFLPRDRPVLSFLAGAFLVWAAASALWAADPDTATAEVERLVQVVLLFAIAYSAIRSSKDLCILAWAFLIGAFATAVYSMATNSFSAAGRLSGLFDPNMFAAQLVASTAIAGFMIAATRRASVRALLFGLILTYATAFVLTQSRGGIVALATALLISIVYAGRYRRHAIVTALMVVAVGVGYFGFVAALDVRERITDFSTEASSGRADEWRIAVEMVRDEPLLGVGIGNYRVVEPEYASRNIDILQPEFVVHNRLVTHNTFLQVMSELGLVGLAIFGALVFATLLAGMRAVRRFDFLRDAPGEAVTRGVLVGILGLLVGYAFLSALYEKQLWLLLGMLLSAQFAVHGREHARVRASGFMRLERVPAADYGVPSRL